MSRFFEIIEIDLHADSRGSVVFPFGVPSVSSAGTKNLHVATINPGAIRGNHRHPDHSEYLIIAGSGTRLVCRGPDGAHEDLKAGGSPLFVKIEKGVGHALINEGREACFLACWHTGRGEVVQTVSCNVLNSKEK